MNKKISTLDALLCVYFFLALPVVIVTVYNRDFSDYPTLGYVVFAIAALRTYQLFVKDRKPTRVRISRFSPGSEVETNVVGVTFENRQDVITKLKMGRKVYLTREPENLHDKNAIKVLVERYTKDEQEKIEPELKDKYGKYSFDEVIKELYALDCIGYISRELAGKISPAFDKYAVKPNQFVPGMVLNLTTGTSENRPMGVRIGFKLPTEEDLKNAINDQILFDMEMDMRRGPF